MSQPTGASYEERTAPRKLFSEAQETTVLTQAVSPSVDSSTGEFSNTPEPIDISPDTYCAQGSQAVLVKQPPLPKHPETKSQPAPGGVIPTDTDTPLPMKRRAPRPKGTPKPMNQRAHRVEGTPRPMKQRAPRQKGAPKPTKQRVIKTPKPRNPRPTKVAQRLSLTPNATSAAVPARMGLELQAKHQPSRPIRPRKRIRVPFQLGLPACEGGAKDPPQGRIDSNGDSQRYTAKWSFPLATMYNNLMFEW